MIEKHLINSLNQPIQIISELAEVADWFNNADNQTETILRQINTERLYDPIFNERKDLVVIDIGANIGLFSLYAKDSSSKLIAVEPAPHTFDILEKLTKEYNNISRVQAAIGDTNDTVAFYLNENATTNSMVSHNGERIDVPGMTIADLIKEHNLEKVDFIKCDIEGSEMLAITDATIDPVKDIVQFWFVEIHQTNGADTAWPGNLESNRQQLKEVFERQGYETDTVIHDQLFAWK
jgi:FkbM family methyltransferase